MFYLLHLQTEKSYMGTLATSMALMLEEFYAGLTTVGLSARTGMGVDSFFDALQVCMTASKMSLCVSCPLQPMLR